MKRDSWNLLLILALIMSCVDPVPISSLQYDEVLVIEGYVSSDFKQQKILLSKTSPINQLKVIPESGASITITDDQGNTMAASESDAGTYLTLPFAGIVGTTYQLHVTTQNGKQYDSEPIILKDVPDIGAIYGVYPSPEPYASSGIQLYIDSPDPSRLTKFYRWEYEDTYEIKAPLESRFEWLGGNNVNVRSIPVDRCWHSDTSKVTLIKDNSHFDDTGVSRFPIKFIPSDARDMVVKFSILVRQYALDEKMYRYWEQLKKINETQGSLFDVQPGTIKGNIHSVSDPNETVLGYFDAGVIKSKRVFFEPREFVSTGFQPVDYFGVCNNINPAQVKFDELGAYMQRNFLTMEIVSAGADDKGNPFYIIWPKTCCDCTREGTNIMPDFWE